MATSVKSRSDVKERINYAQKYNVILLNDDFTTMDFVIKVLTEIFGKNTHDARELMFSIHQSGRGIAGTYIKSIAETKVDEVHSKARAEGFPLKCIMEEA